ncbi:DUF4349 domain-containing protein [Uliginosibacterium sp. sgz301328]|uniref:DUF4349 domain-containing protein n=1 Tax=Uliginosibacterium sp. sgz301328 TaxID=3243764 RepID=UPI00359EF87B
MTFLFRQGRRCLGIVLALTALAACGQRHEAPAMAAPAPSEAVLADARTAAPAASEAPARRYIALKYALTVENDADTLEQSWKGVFARCRELQCDILEGSFARSRDGGSPQGVLRVRIAPDKLDELLHAAEQSGSVVASTMTSEDKTAEVIDVEARIRNMTELRDRLRAMLQNRAGPLKDVLEVERQLADTQSQIDSLAGVRKALAAETEKTEVTLRFVARGRFIDAGKVSPLREAWDNMAEVFLGSVGSLIIFVAAVVPWLVIVVPVVWLLARALRRRRERRAARKAE